jgi:hypothetical protein
LNEKTPSFLIYKENNGSFISGSVTSKAKIPNLNAIKIKEKIKAMSKITQLNNNNKNVSEN